MSERAHYQTLRQHLLQPRDRMDRVENGVMAGMPDINYCGAGVECWIEMKSPREPLRSTTSLFGSNHRLSQDQLNWFRRQALAGGRGFVLISTDKRWLLVPGHVLDELHTRNTAEIIALSIWHTLKPVKGSIPWLQLRSLLLGIKPPPTGINSRA